MQECVCMCVCARAPPKPFAMSPSIFCNVVQNYSLCVCISTCAGGGHPDDDLIYCHLSKLSVGQTPRLCNLPSKSYSNNINVPYTGGNDLVKESDRPFNGMPIRF